MRKILVSGGAGYIGSHMVKLLLENDYGVTVLDNFSNSSLNNLNKVKELTNKDIEIVDQDLTKAIQIDRDFDAIIHFGALKAVGESVANPLLYYKNNVFGTINLLDFAREKQIKNFIFSSTAAVYGNSAGERVSEEATTNPESPYGWSKLMSEQILRDSFKAFGLNSVVLRYFNVAGNIPDGSIGDEQQNPQNLIPAIIMSYLGYRDLKLQVFGNDYNTKDGTGVRDYIHVLDLVDAHLKALEFLERNSGTEIFNLGTGNGYSVLEIIKTCEKVIGDKIDYEIVERRPGDVATVTTDTSKAFKSLKWGATKNVEDMVQSAWLWYKNNFKKV